MPDSALRLDGYLPYRLSVASNAVSRLIARAYEDRFGLTIPQWRLIAVLAEDGPLTQQAIGARTVMDKVTVSRATQGLVKRRLVQTPTAGPITSLSPRPESVFTVKYRRSHWSTKHVFCSSSILPRSKS
jgi:hypothetical protein